MNRIVEFEPLGLLIWLVLLVGFVVVAVAFVVVALVVVGLEVLELEEFEPEEEFYPALPDEPF